MTEEEAGTKSRVWFRSGLMGGLVIFSFFWTLSEEQSVWKLHTVRKALLRCPHPDSARLLPLAVERITTRSESLVWWSETHLERFSTFFSLISVEQHLTMHRKGDKSRGYIRSEPQFAPQKADQTSTAVRERENKLNYTENVASAPKHAVLKKKEIFFCHINKSCCCEKARERERERQTDGLIWVKPFEVLIINCEGRTPTHDDLAELHRNSLLRSSKH